MKLKREMKIHKIVSPAKINLNLKVINFDELLKKHRLSSRISIVKLHDKIEIYHSNKLSITYRDGFFLIRGDRKTPETLIGEL